VFFRRRRPTRCGRRLAPVGWKVCSGSRAPVELRDSVG
jgi:hypothetical protein